MLLFAAVEILWHLTHHLLLLNLHTSNQDMDSAHDCFAATAMC
jgi:hypothetical protein